MSDRRGSIPAKEVLEKTLPRGYVVTTYGRDAAVVDFEQREPLDPESFGYRVGLIDTQGDLEAWCKQVPSGRACPSSGNRGKWCKHIWTAIILWGRECDSK